MDQILINKNVSVPVAPGMIGLFFEDINYNLDGGLHAEMLENRNFEALRVTGYWDDYRTEQDGLYAWSTSGDAEIAIETEDPQNEVNPHYLRLTAKAASAANNARIEDLKDGDEEVDAAAADAVIVDEVPAIEVVAEDVTPDDIADEEIKAE